MASGESFTLSEGSLKVTGTTPVSWGKPVLAVTNENSIIQTGAYAQEFLNVQAVAGSTWGSSVIFESFPLSQPKHMGVNAPSLTLVTYPPLFTDDDPDDYQAMTAAQKQAVIDPLVQIYNQRGIGSMQLTQMDAMMEGAPLYRGGWWSNTGAHGDRMGVRYVENATGTLRGIAFFANETQDYGFYPSYKIVLIHPEDRMIVLGHFSLTEQPEFTPFTDAIQRSTTPQEIGSAVMQAYKYLNDPKNYAQNRLGTFIQEVDSLVTSMNIR
jgi:uncharacterized membrane protein YfbV (UPF0208 family)